MNSFKTFQSIECLLKFIKIKEYYKKNNYFKFSKFTTHLKPILKKIFLYRKLPKSAESKGTVLVKKDRIYIFYKKKKEFETIEILVHELCHIILKTYEKKEFSLHKDFYLAFLLHIRTARSELLNQETEQFIDRLTKHIILPTNILKKYIVDNEFKSISELIKKMTKVFKINENFLLERIMTEIQFDNQLQKKIFNLLKN